MWQFLFACVSRRGKLVNWSGLLAFMRQKVIAYEKTARADHVFVLFFITCSYFWLSKLGRSTKEKGETECTSR